MKNIVVSIGSLAWWWVVGYSIQAAVRILEKAEGPQGPGDTPYVPPEYQRLAS